MYYVYGWDRKTEDKVMLYDTDHKETALRWAKGYTKQGDMGGWDMIVVLYEYQDDVDWEGDPVVAQVTLWSCWREPMQWCDNAMEEF